MDRVMEEARTRGVRSVYAYVSVDNKVGHSLTPEFSTEICRG